MTHTASCKHRINMRLLFHFQWVLVILISVSRLNAQGTITTYAGSGTQSGFSGDGGAATSALFSSITSVASDALGNIYVTDQNNNRVRKISNTGIVSTIAGNGTAGFSGDGGLATAAKLNRPIGVAVDAAGNVFIDDVLNWRIRKVDASTGIISTYAGDGTGNFSGDGGPAVNAGISSCAVALDADGNLYLAERDMSRIRKIDASGTITTIAGTGVDGFFGDNGLATNAQLSGPSFIYVSNSGNIYIADQGNRRIRKIDSSGIISTVAGNGVPGYSGDGGPATAASLFCSAGMQEDAQGNLYFADACNNCIRKIDGSGIITTVAGNTTGGFSGDGGPALQASLFGPSGLTFDSDGNYYIADMNNNRVRKVVNSSSASVNTIDPTDNFVVFPNPTSSNFRIDFSKSSSWIGCELIIFNNLGQSVFSKTISTQSTWVDISDLSLKGIYYIQLHLPNSINYVSRKIVIE